VKVVMVSLTKVRFSPKSLKAFEKLGTDHSGLKMKSCCFVGLEVAVVVEAGPLWKGKRKRLDEAST
jgi:hypothetical protein